MKLLDTLRDYLEDRLYGEVVQVELHCALPQYEEMLDLRRYNFFEDCPVSVTVGDSYQTSDGQVIALGNGTIVIKFYRKGSFFKTPSFEEYAVTRQVL